MGRYVDEFVIFSAMSELIYLFEMSAFFLLLNDFLQVLDEHNMIITLRETLASHQDRFSAV